MASSQDWHKETRSHKPGHLTGRAGKTEEEGLPELGVQGRAKVGHGVLPSSQATEARASPRGVSTPPSSPGGLRAARTPAAASGSPGWGWRRSG